jgi:uncharacterized protein (DUF433 family)
MNSAIAGPIDWTEHAIVCTPGVNGGRPRIAGAGVSVQRVVGWHRLGYSAEEIARLIGHISIWDVYCALAYYCTHREAIDQFLADEEADYDRLAAEFSEGIQSRP